MRPDIVHLHSSFAGAVVRAFLPGSRGTPHIVYSPHGWSFAMDTFGAAKLAYAAIERRLAAGTDLILVNSVSEYELAIEFGLPERKMKLVTHGISWAPAPQRRSGSGPMRIAFIGRHDRQKGLDILVDAIGRFGLRHIHFHIVGERVISGSAGQSAPAAENVTVHGWLSRADTSALIQQMDAVVMPSRWEAFGLVAIEAMRAGVAVIASNRGALPEVVRNGIGGRIFDIDDPDALGRLLEGLDLEELRRLGESARHLWERKYVATRMNRLTCEAYDSVLAAPVLPQPISSPRATHRTAPQPV
jgi:glycosyltransferase involved in cell wall biosynthesis